MEHNNNRPSELVDYLGVESSVDLKPDTMRRPHPYDLRYRSPRSTAEKEYPPPIENLPSHVPWVMKRYHTSDGRLIIKEEKVKGREYFKADRSNGRLVLKLVQLEDDDDDEIDDPTVEESCKYNGRGGGFGMAVQVAFPPPLHT